MSLNLWLYGEQYCTVVFPKVGSFILCVICSTYIQVQVRSLLQILVLIPQS